jgi:hypothetical protein
MKIILLLIVVIILIYILGKSETYRSCRDCPEDSIWPNFTTYDLTVLNPFLWPFSALPSSEAFTGNQDTNGVKVAVEEHNLNKNLDENLNKKKMPAKKKEEDLKQETDHDALSV